ncbi:MAG: Asp/Glu/hydantoin racemase [Acidobacteria bacterium]|nr:Asp/Glu/hydantoin racemase [Acidobacteriota bacterium]
MQHRLALLHTSPVLVPVFDGLCQQVLPEVERYHMVDESLIRNTVRAGRLEKPTIRRLVAEIGVAFEGGATAVFVTCSSIGPGVSAARQLYEEPIFRIDEAMAAKAVTMGSRVGVLATVRTTLEPTVQLIRDSAKTAGTVVTVEAGLCEGAFDAVLAGDGAGHDRIVREGLMRLAGLADVVVLAQASMARVIENIAEGELKVPVLTSPMLAVQQIRVALGLSRAQVPVGVSA